MNLVGRLCPFFLLLSSLLMAGCNPPQPTVPTGQEADHDHGDAEHEHHESMPRR